MKKRIIIGTLSIGLLIIISLLIINKNNQYLTNIKTVEDINTNINLETSYEEVEWNSLKQYDLELSNESINITKEGIYTLSGTINNGSLTIDTTGNVKLIFNNINITNKNGPAIIIKNANNTLIELKNDTNNILEDGSTYDNSEYEGCVFSKDDLIFEGDGTLKIISNYLDGIVTKDDLKIINGTYYINSNDDGIRGKDSVYIVNGNFTINAKGDAIKATNTTDQAKGYISIENGIFNIEAEKDGFQAETKLLIHNGEFNIKTSDGSSATNSAIYKQFYNGSTYDTESTKALKSKDNLLIESGTFNIDSKDDAIHSNNYLGIKDGTITISSGDDGIHADEEIIIENGSITINQAYEGIEAQNITINNGNISIISKDDGINISGGNDSSSMQERPGQNPISSSSGTLTINNGTVKVNASGDGLDANGSIIINNGKITVDGPTNNGNGALDYDIKFELHGGVFIAVGSSGMSQNISDSSKQYSLMFNLSSQYNSETIAIEDNSGKKIISYTPEKQYQSIIISTPDITKNTTYTLKINNKDITTITTTSINSTTGNNNGMGGSEGPPGKNHPPTRR